MRSKIIIIVMAVLLIPTIASAEIYDLPNTQFELHFLDPLPLVALVWGTDYVAGFYSGNTVYIVGYTLHIERYEDFTDFLGYRFYRR